MTALVDRLLPLWTRPVHARDDPRAAFAEVYADPVVVNGTAMTITELVDRARSLQQAFDRLGMDIVDTVEAPPAGRGPADAGPIRLVAAQADGGGSRRRLAAARPDGG
jgi:hypothetical protein